MNGVFVWFMVTAVFTCMVAAILVYIWPRMIMRKVHRRLSAYTDASAVSNELQSYTHLFTPEDTHMIPMPNNDTLYSQAWIDLSKGPLVFHIPHMQGRYYTFQFLDLWTDNVGYIGHRTTGTQEQNYLLVGPSWNGQTPQGMTVLRIPVDVCWLLGRTLVYGSDDLEKAVSLVNQYSLMPLTSIK